MFRQRGTSHLSAAIPLTGIVMLIAAGAPSIASAAPPARRNCAQEDVYERLTCRQAALADQLEYASETVFAEGTKLHQRARPAHIAHIKSAKENALRAKTKHTRETFKRLAKAESIGNKKGGHLVPFSANDDTAPPDGVCDYEQGNPSARCAAVELGPSGETQVCNPLKKNKAKGTGGGNPRFEGLECDLSVDEEASTASEELDMEEAAGQLEATYSATESDLIEMNEQLDIVNANLPEESGAASNAVDPCVMDPVTEGLPAAVAILRGVHAVVFGAARIAADFGGQDFVVFGFGGNTRTLAVVFDSAALAANMAYIITDEILKAESGDRQAAIAACVSQSSGDIAALQARILELQGVVERAQDEIIKNNNENRGLIVATLEAVRRQVVDLLNTPLGRRPEFPQ